MNEETEDDPEEEEVSSYHDRNDLNVSLSEEESAILSLPSLTVPRIMNPYTRFQQSRRATSTLVAQMQCDENETPQYNLGLIGRRCETGSASWRNELVQILDEVMVLIDNDEEIWGFNLNDEEPTLTSYVDEIQEQERTRNDISAESKFKDFPAARHH